MKATRFPGTVRVSFFKSALSAALDPGAHVAQAAAFRTPPPEALREASEAVEAYQHEETLAWPAVMPALLRADYAIKNSQVSTKIIPLVKDFYHHFNVLNQNSNSGARQAYVRNNIDTIKDDFNNAAKLLANESLAILFCDKLSSLLHERDGRKESLERDLDRLALDIAAFTTHEGRTPSSFANDYSNAPGDPGSFAITFKRILTSRARGYRVLVVIDHAGDINLPDDSPFFHLKFPISLVEGLAYKKRGDNTEPMSVPPSAHADVIRFCENHWNLLQSNEPANRTEVRSSILAVDIQAWDIGQARHGALDLAEKLVDSINAEHRTDSFGVKRKVLVWPHGSKEATVVSTDARFVHHARTSSPRTNAIGRSLRFASRASAERSGSMQTFFAWIALEYLAHGSSSLKPQNLIATKLPRVVSLVCTQRLIFDAWYVISTKDQPIPDEVHRAIRKFRRGKWVTSKAKFNPTKLTALVISDDEHLDHLMNACKISLAEAQEVISSFKEHIANLDPYSQYRFKKLRRILREPSELDSFMTEAGIISDLALQRMRFVRNQTAHSGDFDSVRHLALGRCSLTIMDASFQVVTRWSTPSVEAIENLHDRSLNLQNEIRELAKNSYARHEPKFNLDILRES